MRQIVLDKNALEDLIYWSKHHKKKTKRILELIKESAKSPTEGKGKPEPLKYNFKGCWSRRIDQEHRLVYVVKKDAIRVLACRYHY